MGKFPFSFRSKVSGDSRLDLALASNFDKAATEDYVDAAVAAGGGGGGVTDHGALTGLSDDDHTQYHNDTRGDARYQLLDADLTTIAALDSGTAAGVMATEAAGWVKRTYAQVKTSLGLVKADVGLGNVDNTTDASKPVSTAQQTALDLKANLASPTFTGAPSLPTAATAVTQAENDASTKLSTTAYVDRATGNASSNRPVGRAALTSAQSIANNAWTAISFNSELTDSDAMVDIAGQPTRITAVTAGTYLVSGHVNVVGNATGRQGSRIVHKNSAGTVQGYYCAQVQENVSGGAESPGTAAAVVLAAGDYVQLECYQSSGGAINTAAFSSTNHAELHVAWVGGTGAAWGNAGCKAYQTAGTSIPNTGAATELLFDTEEFDIDGMHSTSSATGRLTCTVPGTYQISGFVGFQATDAAGYRLAEIRKNGVAIATTTMDAGDSATHYHRVPISVPTQMVVGDYIQIFGAHTGGAAITTTTGIGGTQLSAVRVGYQTNPSKDGQMVSSGRVIRTSTWTTGALAASATSSSIESITVTGDGVNRMEIVASGWNYLASAANPFYFQLYDSTGGVGIGSADQQPPVVNTRSCGHVVADLAPFTGSKTIQLRVVNYSAGGITVQGDATAITSAKPARLVAKWIPA